MPEATAVFLFFSGSSFSNSTWALKKKISRTFSGASYPCEPTGYKHFYISYRNENHDIKDKIHKGEICPKMRDVYWSHFVMNNRSSFLSNSEYETHICSQDSLRTSAQRELWQLAAAEPRPLQSIHGWQSKH